MPQESSTAASPDPIDNTDPRDLRMEILRLRDHSLGLVSHAEVLADRVVELETQNNELHEAFTNISRTAQRTIDELTQTNTALTQTNTELTQTNTELNEVNQALRVELNRSPLIRIARGVARRFKLVQ